jgi:hypothetical protein
MENEEIGKFIEENIDTLFVVTKIGNEDNMFIDANSCEIALLIGEALDEDGSIHYGLFDLEKETVAANVNEVKLHKLTDIFSSTMSHQIDKNWRAKFDTLFEVVDEE